MKAKPSQFIKLEAEALARQKKKQIYYKTNKELPEKVKKGLPSGAQTIYRKAFNLAYKERKGLKGIFAAKREIISHRAAWNAVRKAYKRTKSGKWERKQ